MANSNCWPWNIPKPQHGLTTSVDGVGFGYKEEQDEDGNLDTGLYFHQINGPGLNYELVIGLYSGFLCFLRGGKGGELSDMTLAKSKNGLIAKLRQCDEKCIADGTYRNPVFINTKRGNPWQLSLLIAAAKARHETVNRRFKRASIFTGTRNFRHDREFHGMPVLCNGQPLPD